MALALLPAHPRLGTEGETTARAGLAPAAAEAHS